MKNSEPTQDQKKIKKVLQEICTLHKNSNSKYENLFLFISFPPVEILNI